MFFKKNSIKAKEILDSAGRPTVEVALKNKFGTFKASVPSGVSTGKYEAMELRDADGRGVKKAIENVNKIIAPALANEDLSDQKRIDDLLIKLDGTKNKSLLGANAILPVSIAVCRYGAAFRKISLYKYINEITEDCPPINLPKPSFNMIEGGKHSESGLAFQEFMIIPQNASFKENFELGKVIYNKLKDILEKKYSELKLSAEGAFTVPVDTYEALRLILEAGQGEDIRIAIDAASSSFYQDGKYKFEGNILSREELMEKYQYLVSHYPIISIEDPFEEEDFEAWSQFKYKIQDTRYKIQVLGDDLTASNPERIRMAYDKNLCNGIILKPNQIGTVTETLNAAALAQSFEWKIMVANRAGETKDDFIADLAVGIGAEFIKSGAPFAKERMVKYNRLREIEKERS